jgi:hypothetical protein
MSDNNDLMAAITDRDAATVRQHFLNQQFILISIVEEEEEDEDDQVGALTAEINDFDVLVVFTSEETAEHFVQSMGDMFEDQEVSGSIFEGETLLEYLPENFGLLIDAESKDSRVVDPLLVSEVLAASE